MEKKLQPEASDDKAKLTLLEGGRGLTIERVLAFQRKFFRRELTEEEIAKTHEQLCDVLPAK